MTPNLEISKPVEISNGKSFRAEVRMIDPQKQFEIGVRIENRGSDEVRGCVVGCDELSATATTVEQMLDSMRTQVRRKLETGLSVPPQRKHKARSEEERWILVAVDNTADTDYLDGPLSLPFTETIVSADGIARFNAALAAGLGRPTNTPKALPMK